jgi:hypothetical protein
MEARTVRQFSPRRCALKYFDFHLVFAGIPRMNPELTWMVAIFWIARKSEWEVWMATDIAGSPNGVEGLIWPFFLGIRTHSSCRLLLNA